MKKIILSIIAKIANVIDYKNSYQMKVFEKHPFIFKFNSEEEGIASLTMYRVAWLFYVPFIETNNAFYTFESDEQAFILAHELGHYKYKHYKWYYNDMYLTDEELNELEKQADLFAMLKTNKEVALRTMNKMLDYLIELDVEQAHLDLVQQRIKYLESVKERAK